MTYRERATILLSRRLMPEGWATTRMTTIKLGHLPHGAWGRAMIDWKNIRKLAETAALLSILAGGEESGGRTQPVSWIVRFSHLLPPGSPPR